MASVACFVLFDHSDAFGSCFVVANAMGTFKLARCDWILADAFDSFSVEDLLSGESDIGDPSSSDVVFRLWYG